MKLRLGVFASVCSAFLLAGTISFGVGSASAYSFPLYNSSVPGAAGTLFEDDDRDFFNDNDGDGLITPGDVVVAAVEFAQVLSNEGIAPAYALDTANDELVALSILRFDSIAANGDWIFGEYMNNPLLSFWQGGPLNLDLNDNSLTQAQAIAAITDGTKLWDFSLDPADPDTYWSFTPLLPGANDPSIVNALPSALKIGIANYQLNQTFGVDIFTPIQGLAIGGGDGMIDLLGSADILGGQFLTGAFARSDADINLNAVPEPATMTLFGIGLMGLGLIGRRRARK